LVYSNIDENINFKSDVFHNWELTLEVEEKTPLELLLVLPSMFLKVVVTFQINSKTN
jgi:hypothetical protein